MTAAVMAEMDVIVFVDTWAAYLAGAMGWSVWLMLPRGGESGDGSKAARIRLGAPPGRKIGTHREQSPVDRRPFQHRVLVLGQQDRHLVVVREVEISRQREISTRLPTQAMSDRLLNQRDARSRDGRGQRAEQDERPQHQVPVREHAYPPMVM
jgi:hypothetical protein